MTDKLGNSRIKLDIATERVLVRRKNKLGIEFNRYVEAMDRLWMTVPNIV